MDLTTVLLECLLPSLAFALPRVLTFSSNNTEILLRVCISVNVLHIKDISEKILYIKEKSHQEDSWLKGSGKVLDEECSLNNLERGGSEPKLKG